MQGILEALEFLLENNYSFQRTFYIGLGHDEEVFRQFFKIKTFIVHIILPRCRALKEPVTLPNI